jgi:hypothetical protein
LGETPRDYSGDKTLYRVHPAKEARRILNNSLFSLICPKFGLRFIAVKIGIG